MFLELLQDFLGWKDTLTWLLKMHKTILFELTVVWKGFFQSMNNQSWLPCFEVMLYNIKATMKEPQACILSLKAQWGHHFKVSLTFCSCQRFWRPVFDNLCPVVPEPLWLLWCHASHLPSSVSQEHQTSLLAMLRMKQPQLV